MTWKGFPCACPFVREIHLPPVDSPLIGPVTFWYFLSLLAWKTVEFPVIWDAMSLTHWGRVTHICVSKLTIIVPDNDLSPDRRQAIIWTNAGILLIRTTGTIFSEVSSEIHIFSFKKMHLKISSAKWRSFCLGLNVLMWHHCSDVTSSFQESIEAALTPASGPAVWICITLGVKCSNMGCGSTRKVGRWDQRLYLINFPILIFPLLDTNYLLKISFIIRRCCGILAVMTSVNMIKRSNNIPLRCCQPEVTTPFSQAIRGNRNGGSAPLFRQRITIDLIV